MSFRQDGADLLEILFVADVGIKQSLCDYFLVFSAVRAVRLLVESLGSQFHKLSYSLNQAGDQELDFLVD